MRGVATWPLMTTRGMESMLAVAMPVTMLQTPGPDVAKQTPGLAVSGVDSSLFVSCQDMGKFGFI